MRALAFFLGALAGSAAMPDRDWQWRSSGNRAALDLEPVALPPVRCRLLQSVRWPLGRSPSAGLKSERCGCARSRSTALRCINVTEEPAGESNSTES